MKTFRLIPFILVMGLILSGCSKDKKEVAEETREDMLKATRAREGQMAPDFSFVTDSGDTLSLHELRGKVVVLNFWANWCPVCREEIPYLEKEIWQRFQGKNYVLVGIGREHDMATVKAFKDSMQITYPVAPDTGRHIYSLFAEKYIPRTLIIDRDGKVVRHMIGFTKEEFSELTDQLQHMLSE